MKTKNLLLKALFVFSPWALGNNLSTPVMLVEKSEDFFTSSTLNDLPNVFKLQRTYHSRSLHRGLLGYGWCLSFEKVLIKQPDGRIDLFSCSSDRPVRFQFHHQSQKHSIYKSGKYPTHTLILMHNQMIVTDGQSNQWYFDSGGHLRRWLLPQNQRFYLTRSRDGTPEQLAGPFGKVRLVINQETGLLEKIDWNQRRITYSFKEFLLTSVKTPSTFWSYQYDFSRNLTRIEKNGQHIKSISYNTSNDEVQQLIESSYILKLNPAGQIITMEHPKKGKVTFNYDNAGSIIRVYWKQQVWTLSEIQGMPKRDPRQIQIVEYLLVASRAIQSLKSL